MPGILALLRSKRQEPSLTEQVRLLIAYAAEHHLLTGSTPEQDTALQSRIIAPLMAAQQKYAQDPGNLTNETDLLILRTHVLSPRLAKQPAGRFSIARIPTEPYTGSEPGQRSLASWC